VSVDTPFIFRWWTKLPIFALALLFYRIPPAEAVLFYGTAAANYHTNAPDKAFADSGWQYVGTWGGFTGTAISTNYFITARHFGGSVGDPFVFHGTTNLTTAGFEDPESDLKIWRVSGTLSPIAPLYTKGNEGLKGVIVIGRGTQRGAEVSLNGRLHGWQWGEADGVQRWGRSVVTGIIPAGSGGSDMLRMVFKANSTASGVDLSGGDSGGPVFIKDGKFWKLAGVNYGADSIYNTSNSGEGFRAALFDKAGFYVQDASGTNWMLVPNHGSKSPGGFSATRISSRISWIRSVIEQP
jgi:hypothetical protein